MLSEMVEKGGLGQPQDTLSTETLANYQTVLPVVLGESFKKANINSMDMHHNYSIYQHYVSENFRPCFTFEP
jgi:hypothetical protein